MDKKEKNGTKDLDEKRLDKAVDKFKESVSEAVGKPKAVDESSLKITSTAIRGYIEDIVKDTISQLSKTVIENQDKINTSIDMYSKITLDVEKRQTALESKANGVIGTIKFLFGGGCLLTIINVIILIIMMVVKK